MSKVAKKRSRRQLLGLRAETPKRPIEADQAEETIVPGASITTLEDMIEEQDMKEELTAEGTTTTTETRVVKMVKRTEEATEAVAVAEEAIVRIGLVLLGTITEIKIMRKIKEIKESLKMETDMQDQELHEAEVNIEVAEVSVVPGEVNTEEEVVIEVEDNVVKEVNSEETKDGVAEVAAKNKKYTINPKKNIQNQLTKLVNKADLCLLLLKKSGSLTKGSRRATRNSRDWSR